MKKSTLTLLIAAAILPATALANNAVLNVEGEIQVNGKTVINSNGEVIGVSGSPAGIVLDDYFGHQATGSYSGERDNCSWTEQVTESLVTYQEICTNTWENFVTEEEPNPNYIANFWGPSAEAQDACYLVSCDQEYIWDDELQSNIPNPDYDPDFWYYPSQEEQDACFLNSCDQEYVYIDYTITVRSESVYEEEVTPTAQGDRVDWAWSYTEYADRNDGQGEQLVYEDDGSGFDEYKLETLIAYPANYQIGTVVSDLVRETVLASSDQGYVGNINYDTDVFVATGELKDVTLGGQYYEHCILIEDNDDFEIACKDKGLVPNSDLDTLQFGAPVAMVATANVASVNTHYASVKRLREKQISKMERTIENKRN
ncbi:hypothetical protein JCM19241_1095 [Vibrio ishigakensis]|uniref:Uncharacterized protein n=1 Tax=Vibrio ishigakensis TaxID=1481914 RepID=A0A0B8QCS3_9VIBR|nr:hypothetical protein JCM19241_1095 [Vibrio ishigakensis]